MKKALQKNDKMVVLQELGKANLVISQFIRSCSHSMRGPLKSIQGIVNLLQTAPNASNADVKLMIGLIKDNSTKMENMLNDLEQFMFNTSKESKFRSVNLDELIHSITASFQRDIEKQGIQISVKVDQNNDFLSDSARIRLILNHLIMNAITFQQPDTTNKQITILCSTDHEKCTISVTDNGIGIDADQQKKIFQIFYQATTNSQGAGIGLFIVREALDKMDGTITLVSTPGHGSTFQISIPNRVMKLSRK